MAKNRKFLQQKADRSRAKKLKTDGESDSQKIHKCTPQNSPEMIFQSLIEPINLNEFFGLYWEKKPVVIVSEKPKTTVHDWFSKEKALQLLRNHELHYLLDIHFCVCADGKTKDLNKTGKVTEKEFTKLMNKMCATAQIHQVQRFVDPLWYVMENLESLFGSLVGSNVYITPSGSQGLAPHYDDVEVFIFQLEGEKHWRLYKPPVELAREYKSNLSSEDIGDPTHEFILKPGDVLYMPRGTVHQADTPASATSHSTHITISMYQNHSVGDLLKYTFPKFIESGLQDFVNLRKGLPLGFYQMNKSLDATNLVVSSLENIIEGVKKWGISPPSPMIEDFMSNRLPPYGFEAEVLDESPSGLKPTLKSEICFTYPTHVSAVLKTCEEIFEDDESDSDIGNNDEQSDESVLIVYSSIRNQRESHMIKTKMDSEDGNGFHNYNFTRLKFPSKFDVAVQQLLSERSYLPVKCLVSLTDEEKLQLVTSLWAEHLLTVK